MQSAYSAGVTAAGFLILMVKKMLDGYLGGSDRTGEAGLRGPASPMGPGPASDPGPGRDSTRDPLNTHKGPTEHTQGTN